MPNFRLYFLRKIILSTSVTSINYKVMLILVKFPHRHLLSLLLMSLDELGEPFWNEAAFQHHSEDPVEWFLKDNPMLRD